MDINIIENNIKNKGLSYKKIGDIIRIKCIFPDHIDTVPSLTLYPNGRFYCFGCKKYGEITDLFKLKYKGLKADLGRKLYFEPIVLYTEGLKNVELPENKPVKSVIRNISLKTLKKFDVRKNELGYIIPIYFYNYFGKNCVGYSIRKFSGSPKWLHLPSEKTVNNSHFSRYIYPNFDKLDYIILVEGLFDALKLIDCGFPASACFSTRFSKEKLFSLYKMAPRFVFIIFDNDKAGKDGAIEFKSNLKKEFIVKTVSISRDPDEFFCIEENVNKLKKYIKEVMYGKNNNKVA